MSPTIMCGRSPASSRASAPPCEHGRGAVTEVGGKARHLDAAREQLVLLAHVFERVQRKALDGLADLEPARLGLGSYALGVEHIPARQRLAVAQHLGRGIG